MKKPKILSSSWTAVALMVSTAGTVALAGAPAGNSDQPLIQQTSQTSETTTTTTTTTTAPQTISKCSQLIGTKVQNQQGDCLGKITDVVVSFNNNQASYCVLSVKHGMFARAKYVAVPVAAFQPGVDGSYLILNANPANLAQARGFSRNEWPTEIIPTWGAEPGPAVELPAAVVYGQVPAPVPQRPQTWAADPVSSSPPMWQSAGYSIAGLQDQVQFGAALMTH
jgi:sporulation protein YlmC with PRC-barrel domain